MFGDVRHQALQELPPGERVEAGHGLVEDEQLRSLRDGEGQRKLGALPAGQLPGLLGRVEAEFGDPVIGNLLIPAGVGVGTETQMVGDGQARVGGRVLGDEAHLGQLCGTGRRLAAEHLDAARRGSQQAHRDVQQGRLAGTVRADQAHDPAGRDGEGAVGQRLASPVPLGQALGL